MDSFVFLEKGPTNATGAARKERSEEDSLAMVHVDLKLAAVGGGYIVYT